MIKLNTNSFIKNIDSTFLLKVFREGMALDKAVMILLTELQEIKDKPEEYDYDAGCALLDPLDSFLLLPLENISKFQVNYCAGYIDLRRRLTDAMEACDKVFNIINKAIIPYVPLGMTEINELFLTLCSLKGHLGIFLVRQFELKEITQKPPHKVVEIYCDDNGITLENLRDYAFALEDFAYSCRPRIDVFDEYPELESDFYAIVGDEFYDTAYLTYEQVVKTVNGDYSLEDLMEQLNASEAD